MTLLKLLIMILLASHFFGCLYWARSAVRYIAVLCPSGVLVVGSVAELAQRQGVVCSPTLSTYGTAQCDSAVR